MTSTDWIATADRKPQPGQRVLVLYANGVACPLEWPALTNYEQPTHWQPWAEPVAPLKKPSTYAEWLSEWHYRHPALAAPSTQEAWDAALDAQPPYRWKDYREWMRDPCVHAHGLESAFNAGRERQGGGQ